MGNFSNYWDLHTLFTKIGQKLKAIGNAIPTKLSQLTDDSTHRTVTDTEKTTWNNKSDFSGSYNDLTNKPTIPTVNNATLTIQKNGTNVQTFTANQSTNATANITVPTKTSELTNNSNFVADASYVHTDNNYTTTEKNKLAGIASGAEVNVQSDWNQTTTTADDYIKNKPSSMPASDVYAWAKASSKPTYTASEVGALPLSGGNMTGNIGYTGSKATYQMIKFIDNNSDNYGNGIAIGGGGQTIIGGGESSDVMMGQAGTAGSEVMWIGNDGDVNMYTNLQSGWASRQSFSFGANGNLSVPGSISEAGTVLSNKYQSKLTFDTTPTAGSTNPVTSGGIKTALDSKQNKLPDIFSVREGSSFGGHDEYIAFDSGGLQIYQHNDETAGIGITGDGIYMWAPPDDTCLRFYNEDTGSMKWEIDSDGVFTGSIKNSKVFETIFSGLYNWSFTGTNAGSSNTYTIANNAHTGDIYIISACYDYTYKQVYVVDCGSTYSFNINYSGIFVVPSSLNGSALQIKVSRDTSQSSGTTTIQNCFYMSIYKITLYGN